MHDLRSLRVLMFELLIARLADFFLGFRNSFLALPVTFLGLALGSLYVHFRPKLVERFSVRGSLFGLAAVSFTTLVVVLAILTRSFNIIASDEAIFYLSDAAAKTAVFVAGFIVPFFVFGRILTLCYHVERDHIGSIYSADFFGAALGCFVTPVLFHFVSLPEVVLVWTATLSVVMVFFLRSNRRVTAAAIAALLALNGGLYVGVRWLERSVEYRYYSRGDDPATTREIASRWNEFSRVQLVRFEFKKKSASHVKVIHDDGRSNVHVREYVPGRTATPKIVDALEAPFILQRPIREALVMFAGAGDEMIRIRELSGQTARVSGVEINPACVALPTAAPELSSLRLAEFATRRTDELPGGPRLPDAEHAAVRHDLRRLERAHRTAGDRPHAQVPLHGRSAARVLEGPGAGRPLDLRLPAHRADRAGTQAHLRGRRPWPHR